MSDVVNELLGLINDSPTVHERIQAHPDTQMTGLADLAGDVERLSAERDAFKLKLMETFVYMMLLADKIEATEGTTTAHRRELLAKEIRQFVRDGHKL